MHNSNKHNSIWIMPFGESTLRISLFRLRLVCACVCARVYGACMCVRARARVCVCVEMPLLGFGWLRLCHEREFSTFPRSMATSSPTAQKEFIVNPGGWQSFQHSSVLLLRRPWPVIIGCSEVMVARQRTGWPLFVKVRSPLGGAAPSGLTWQA